MGNYCQMNGIIYGQLLSDEWYNIWAIAPSVFRNVVLL